jgi:hypothetical protein
VMGGLRPNPPEYTASGGARLRDAAPTRKSAGCAARDGDAGAHSAVSAAHNPKTITALRLIARAARYPRP